MKKAEEIPIEQLSLYFSYKLKGNAIACDWDIEEINQQLFRIETGGTYKNPNNKEPFLIVGGSEVDINDFKPIVRPLSLTKEIEHDGEKFVPIVKLDYLFGTSSEAFDSKNETIQNRNWIKIWNDKSFFSISIDEEIIKEPYWVVNKLISWHFDIFGWIDKILC